jgi:hypothetical protein
MWNETDSPRRRALVAQTVTEHATYVDPLMAGEGIDGIDAMIAGAQQQFPGHTFTLTSGPDTHHSHIRFAWSLASEGHKPIAYGTDFATIADDGRLHDVTGFLDQTSID